MTIQRCRYEECGREGDVNEEGACSCCAPLVARIRDRIEAGTLPRIRQAQQFPPITSAPFNQGGMPCVACDETIPGKHDVYPDPNRGVASRTDLHMHRLCSEIWETEA